MNQMVFLCGREVEELNTRHWLCKFLEDPCYSWLCSWCPLKLGFK